MHLCKDLPPYRLGPLICNGKCRLGQWSIPSSVLIPSYENTKIIRFYRNTSHQFSQQTDRNILRQLESVLHELHTIWRKSFSRDDIIWQYWSGMGGYIFGELLEILFFYVLYRRGCSSTSEAFIMTLTLSHF